MGCGRSKLEFLNSESHPCQISSKLYVGLGADARSDGHTGVTLERFVKTI